MHTCRCTSNTRTSGGRTNTKASRRVHVHELQSRRTYPYKRPRSPVYLKFRGRATPLVYTHADRARWYDVALLWGRLWGFFCRQLETRQCTGTKKLRGRRPPWLRGTTIREGCRGAEHRLSHFPRRGILARDCCRESCSLVNSMLPLLDITSWLGIGNEAVCVLREFVKFLGHWLTGVPMTRISLLEGQIRVQGGDGDELVASLCPL